MTAIILGWNPDRWNDWNYPAVVARVAATGLHLERWSVGRHRNIAAGTDAWLLLQGDRGRGLIGHGVVLSEATGPPSRSLRGASRSRRRRTCRWPSTPSSRPASRSPSTFSRRPRPGSPGTAIKPPRWTSSRPMKRPSGPCGAISGRGRPRIPPQPAPGTYPQEAVTRVEVNRYERVPMRGGPASPTTAPAAPPAGSPSNRSTARSARTSSRSTTSSRCPSSAAATSSIPSRTSSRSAPTATPWRTRAWAPRGPWPNCGGSSATPVSSADPTVSPEELEAQRAARELLGPQ